MSGEPKMFRINPENRESEAISEVNFADLGLRERFDIQEWVADNPDILDDGLLIVGKEFSDFDRTNERLDLLAVDTDGKLVIIELKRDDTGADVHWQASKYASYLSKASGEEIARILADYEKISQDDAQQRLLEHLDANDLNVINNDQRIIIASHRFAPEVTSAVLWLNEKAATENMITCVQLIPYRDDATGTLYLQTNTIIPLPGAEQYTVQLGGSGNGANGGSSGPSVQRRRSRSRSERQNDEISIFCRKVAELAKESLSDELMPNVDRGWAMGGDQVRYFPIWYSRYPWDTDGRKYQLHLYQRERDIRVVVNFELSKNRLRAPLNYSTTEIDALAERLNGLAMPDGTVIQDTNTWLRPQITCTATALDDAFAQTVADALRSLIKVCTPAFEAFEAERHEEAI